MPDPRRGPAPLSFHTVALPQAHLLFNVQGELIDEATRTMLQLYMAGWVESIKASK